MTPESITYDFQSQEERDAFLDAEHPERKCLESPGHFKLPDGGELAVFCNTVTWYAP